MVEQNPEEAHPVGAPLAVIPIYHIDQILSLDGNICRTAIYG